MDIIAGIGYAGVRAGALWNKKLKLWVEGRKDLPQRVARVIRPDDLVIWFHAASYGEFEEGRPLIEKIRKKYPQYKLVVTFFSPSGYEAYKNYPHADGVFYLPMDISKQVKAFLDVLHPDIAVFVKYEFWLNLLDELARRKIFSFVISARFLPGSRFFKSYGAPFRHALKAFKTIFVQDRRSVELLNGIGFHNVVQAGDPRFDRVKAVAETAWRNAVIEKFKGDRKLFVAGSLVDESDEALLQGLINNHPATKFLIVPHEMDIKPMRKFIANIQQEARLFSECSEETDFSQTQVLIVNTVGMLSKLYRYGSWAFIGGGFDLGIHSVIEASIYGLPAAFGPNYRKNRPGIEMIELGACTSVRNIEELEAWFSPLEFDEEKLREVSKIAYDYTRENCGASDIILQEIFPGYK